VISPGRIFTVVSRDHLRHQEARRQLKARPERTVIYQPANRETGPGLLLPLIHLFKRYPNSTVAVFPSDHFILQEELFTDYVRQAFEVVERFPAKIAFLAVKPSDPETEYGYILPDYEESNAILPARSVKAFIEKPEAHAAAQILSSGALWNTMVMVFKPEILLHLVSLADPGLYRTFQKIFRALDTPRESLSIEQIYRHMRSVNLSKDLLEGMDVHSRSQLTVITMDGVFWSDWGSEERIYSVFKTLEMPDRIGAPLLTESVGSHYLESRLSAIL
jgi:mannose-1-phosphate guanylyltransferase